MNKLTTMDGSRKSAVLLLSLEQSLAAEVLGKLPRDQVERITLAIASVENVTREEQDAVLNEFKLAFETRPLMHPAGSETARELLEMALEQNEVEPIQQRVDEQILAGPFAFLHRRHPDDIRLLIQSEHPQTIAVVAAQLPAELASQVLAGFESVRQADLLSRMARIGATEVDVLIEIATLLQQRLGQDPVRISGIDRAADLLRKSDRSTSRSLLSAIEGADSRLASSLRDTLFSFKDLVSLDDATLKFILDETDHCQWAIALKGCSDLLRQRVLGLLSGPLATGLKSEMNGLGPLRLSEITEVQKQISATIIGLESKGHIDLFQQQRTKQSLTG